MIALDLQMVSSVSEAPGAALPAKAAALVAAPASGASARPGSSRDMDEIGLGRHPRLERGIGNVLGFGLFRGLMTSTAVGW